MNRTIKMNDGKSYSINYDNVTYLEIDRSKKPQGVHNHTLIFHFNNEKSVNFMTTLTEAREELSLFENYKKQTKENEKENSKMNEIFSDFKGFVKEHKSVFYWLGVLMLVDHFIFHGVFRQKLHGIVEGMVNKLENKEW